MQHRQRINKMFQTGRFQCDYEFYKNLLQWLRALDLYEYEEKVKKNIQIVANIVKLTQKHSDSLAENYDQEKAMNTTKVIHQQIRKINIQATKQIINACNSMNEESYRTKVRNLINNYNQHGKQYAQICTRIWKNVNSEQLRINNLILVVFYMVKNKENLQRNIQIYQKVIQRGMQALKQFPQNFKFIQSHSQIANHKKVHEYLSGTLVISVVLLRFNNVAKVIQGKSSNLTLKLTSLKHTIDNCLSEYPEIALQDIQQEQIPLEAFKSLLRGNKQNSKLINECCNWCLKPGSDLDGKHKICQNIIDLYAQ